MVFLDWVITEVDLQVFGPPFVRPLTAPTTLCACSPPSPFEQATLLTLLPLLCPSLVAPSHHMPAHFCTLSIKLSISLQGGTGTQVGK